jgi:phage shock protein B
MDDIAILIPFVAILSLFVVFPWIILHYMTKWRGQRGLTQDDERMLEDLWRSARDISRRLEAVEHILDVKGAPGAERSSSHDR